jgi:nicotinamidase-related amidase
MPVTTLDPKTALVVIDLQRLVAKIPTIHPFADVLTKALQLAEGFRAAKLPVVLVNVRFSADGGDALRPRAEAPPRTLPTTPELFEIVPELGPKPGDILVTKRQWGAFYGTDLDLQLRRRGVTGIVLAGISTSIGVDTTARGAHERGYNLTFAADAMTDADAQAHEFVMKKIFPRLGEVDTAAEILRHLPR